MRAHWADAEVIRVVTRNESSEVVREVLTHVQTRGYVQSEEHAHILSRLLELALTHPRPRITVARAARLMYTTRRTLARHCRAAGLPAPCHILTFGRVVNTLRVLRSNGCTVSKAAAATGWPDAFTFSNAMHRLTGIRPSSFRARGLLFVTEAWLRLESATGNLCRVSAPPARCPACGGGLEPDPCKSSPPPPI